MMAAGEIFELPEPLIQHIQSFLKPQEAARTTVLSKSWHSAWLTRPNLDFDQRDFDKISCDDDGSDSLLEYAEKTICRYEISNLMIESFGLHHLDYSHSRRYENMIVRALKLGATRLAIHLNSCPIDLPSELFTSEDFVALTAECLCLNDPGTSVGCSALRWLSLKHVLIESPDVLFRLLASCPLIEKLSLSNTVKLSDGGVGSGGGLIALHRLTSLELFYACFNKLFLNALPSKFPSLKDLTLWMDSEKGIAREEMLISSTSLERLDFNFKRYRGRSNKIQRVKFDLPRICKLSFWGSVACLWDVRPNSMGWEESDVSLMHHHRKRLRHHNRKRLTTNNIDFLGVTLLQGVGVRITNLSQLMYDGLNDLKKARAQIFDKGVSSMWREVPLLDDSRIPNDYRDVRFQLIWQPKQKSKLN